MRSASVRRCSGEALRDHLTAQAARDAHAILHSPATFDEAFELASGVAMRQVERGHVLSHWALECLRAKSYERKLQAAHSGSAAYHAAGSRSSRASSSPPGELTLLRAAATGESPPGVPTLLSAEAQRKVRRWVDEGGECPGGEVGSRKVGWASTATRRYKRRR